MRVVIHDLHSVLIQWEELEGDTFTLFKSTSPDSGFEILATNLTHPFHIDNEVNLFEVGRRYYYKVKGYVGGVEVSESESATPEYNVRDGVTNKVIYENKLALRVMNNPPIFIVLKRRGGKRCPNCWNEITHKVRFANCEVCNGTGFIHGYHKPIKSMISRDFSQLMNGSNMLDDDKVLLSAVDAWITSVPLVSPGDFIVDVMNQRFSIEGVAQRTRSQYVIRQVLNLVPLEKGHPAYSVEVDLSELRK